MILHRSYVYSQLHDPVLRTKSKQLNVADIRCFKIMKTTIKDA